MKTEEQLLEYRKFVVDADQKQQESYDKTVLTLSGGALGITFAFITDIVGIDVVVAPILICLAWILWGLSVCCNLISFFASHLALSKIIRNIDDAVKTNKVDDYLKNPNQNEIVIPTNILNILSGSCFVVGVLLTAVFAFLNFLN